MATKLIVLEPFSAFGKDYKKGDTIPATHTRKWPKDALANRLKGGDVEYRDTSKEEELEEEELETDEDETETDEDEDEDEE